MFIPGRYRITAHTPFCGEEQTFTYYCESEEKLIALCDECAGENGMEWWDEDACDFMDEDDYYAECYSTYEYLGE